MSSLTAIRNAIARAVLGECSDEEVKTGGVSLRVHQRDALRRVRAAMHEFGGALLADETGLGKTYVALALARSFPRSIVLAPAALRQMWYDSAARAEVSITFVSFESLSRRDANSHGDLVIVDEAHHACHPAAARYPRIARLVISARVLLLSATPVRNTAAELHAMLALFLGPRASTLDDASRSRCIIRRSGPAATLPIIDGPHWHPAPHTPGLARPIRALPAPLPTLDGRVARALLTMTLARCWASSLAALDAALRRRLHRGAALEALLDAGRLPTQAELNAWVIGDDAMQLALPLLASHHERGTAPMRSVLREHIRAVRALRGHIAPIVRADTVARAGLLLELRHRYPHRRIIAFSTQAVTAAAIFRALNRVPGVALLTGNGARTASGARPRSDVLFALRAAAPPPRAGAVDDIALVITTDVLSEGVNLQGASVVVHLDVPWTPAGLDQRVGRAARLGSTHASVSVHGIAPPAPAERMLALNSRLALKQAAGMAASRASLELERLRTSLVPWRQEPLLAVVPTGVASARATRRGFLAVAGVGTDLRLLAGMARRDGGFTVSDAPEHALALVQSAEARELETQPEAEAQARASIRRWLQRRQVCTAAGAGTSASRGRRLVLQRAYAALANAPSHSRAGLSGRIADLRTRIDASVSAGAEMLLHQLACRPARDVNAWLAECEALLPLLERAGTPSPAGASPRVVALLLLRPDPAARSAAPGRPVPPGVST